MARVVIGLGCNIEDRAAYLKQSVSQLAELLQDMQCSRVLESQAVLPEGADPSWDMPYLNMAVCGITSLSPQELLQSLKQFERRMGRQSRAVWAPREIDMDILAYDAHHVEDPVLSIPHPRLLDRGFALVPLAELWPQWRCPLPGKYTGWTAADIVKDCGYGCGSQLKATGITLHAA